MIKNFDDVLRMTLGISPENFEAEYFQWTYRFKKDQLTLDFVYSIDGTVSTTLYYKEEIISFCFANGLKELLIIDENIIGKIVQKNSIRQLEINTNNIFVKWTDDIFF